MFGLVTSLLSTVSLLFATPHGPIVTVLIIPADGTPLRIECLAAVNVQYNDKVDRFLHYGPDMRLYLSESVI
jgi:hypothetical protein